MKILVTGAAGQLGPECVRQLIRDGHECVGVDQNDFDLTDPQAVKAYVQSFRPDAIIHCAAWTNMEGAEEHPQRCADVNGMGTLNIVRAALSVGAKLVYISTAQVFSGEGSEPWRVTDRPNPRNIYGLTKAQGEEAVRSLMSRYFIVRSGWIFGASGHGFAHEILRLAGEKHTIRAAGDQIGCPTYAPDLARLIADMVVTENYGIYHAAGDKPCSRAQFADELLHRAGRACTVRPVPVTELSPGYRQPLNLVLDQSSLDAAGFTRLPSWQSSVDRFLWELGQRA